MKFKVSRDNEGKITGLELEELDSDSNAEVTWGEHQVSELKNFESVSLNPTGTQFELAVWDELRKIPTGETRTYGEIARAIGVPKAARAVGRACNRNPIPLLIPCHRVVGSDGKLTGYRFGLAMKGAILNYEARSVNF